MSDGHVVWAKGGTASFLTVQNDVVTLRSTIPSPPGSRLEGSFTADTSTAVSVKVHGSKREPEGAFIIKGRLLDANRALRDRVAALVLPA